MRTRSRRLVGALALGALLVLPMCSGEDLPCDRATYEPPPGNFDKPVDVTVRGVTRLGASCGVTVRWREIYGGPGAAFSTSTNDQGGVVVHVTAPTSIEATPRGSVAPLPDVFYRFGDVAAQAPGPDAGASNAPGADASAPPASGGSGCTCEKAVTEGCTPTDATAKSNYEAVKSCVTAHPELPACAACIGTASAGVEGRTYACYKCAAACAPQISACLDPGSCVPTYKTCKEALPHFFSTSDLCGAERLLAESLAQCACNAGCNVSCPNFCRGVAGDDTVACGKCYGETYKDPAKCKGPYDACAAGN